MSTIDGSHLKWLRVKDVDHLGASLLFLYNLHRTQSGTVLLSVEETFHQGFVHEPPSPPARPITPPTEAMVKEAAAKASIRVSSYMVRS